MKTTKSDWAVISEAKEKGMLVSMNGIVPVNRTELNKRLSKYFRERLPSYSGIFDEFEGEDILYNINVYLKENRINKASLDFPLGNGDNIYLIPITENLQLEVIAVDEYYGSGEYEKYVAIEHFVITEDATEKDVNRLIEFIKMYLV